ncbi:MAG: Benzil reductase ((S)-benzoin forming) [Candidatus Accumulibacter appositus]|uniref:Benzil reductase ((S)-benzoin forming) n=1 Tax=Candidatus Accumulibacter appositus TaxID=1454003 RepID=A0A011PX40_9PROT|nr:SDR family oxidoreductase [Accumulibacter sp.]EXI81587.1 MAG: Benzil reductase ((S)-benzoin forming) [Candidatus Accumulibacter appositus]HRF06849.1 SDR family oxidoreductase [Accumulibacter sp.]
MKLIITGHSRGLGAAIAETLLARGIAVLGLARRGNASLAERYPQLLREVTIDLSDVAALQDWLAGDQLPGFLAGCSSLCLVNNAGTVQPVAPIGSAQNAAIARALNLNVGTPLILANAVIAASPKVPEARILHISSGAARGPYPGWSVYCASKAALDQHARAVALDEVAGVRIASVAPGVIDTDMQAEIRATSLASFPARDKFEALQRNGQLADARECAGRLVAYLLDDRFGSEPVADLRDYLCAETARRS